MICQDGLLNGSYLVAKSRQRQMVKYDLTDLFDHTYDHSVSSDNAMSKTDKPILID